MSRRWGGGGVVGGVGGGVGGGLFFNDTATTEIYTLSLHDALPIYGSGEIRYMPLTRARAERRYNVACSRAKDQMWLFHSLQISELSNPEDLRLRLLSF